jgi:hypothetical protein
LEPELKAIMRYTKPATGRSRLRALIDSLHAKGVKLSIAPSGELIAENARRLSPSEICDLVEHEAHLRVLAARRTIESRPSRNNQVD